MKLAARIRRFRILAGLTQLELAEKAGISRAAVSLYESGDREPELALQDKLATALGITLVDLLGRSSEELTDEAVAFARQLEALKPEQRQAVMDFIRSTLLSKNTAR